MLTCGEDGSTKEEVIEQINNNTTNKIFPVDSIIDLLAVDFSVHKTVNVKGYYAINDGGGDLFNWDSTVDKSTANAGTIIDPGQTLANQGNGTGNGCWVRQYSGAVNVKWFGATGNGVNDDTAFIQKTLDSGIKSLYLSSGAYVLGEVTVPSDVKISGTNKGDVEIIPLSSTGNIFKMSSRSYLGNVTFHCKTQVYQLTSDYINENFNPTSVPITNNGISMDVVIENVATVGFNTFVEQSDEDTSDLSVWTFRNIRGFPLKNGFNIKRSFDILKFDNVHFNLNYYKKLGYSNVDIYYYSKCMLQTDMFKFGRVDDAQISNCFIFGAKSLLTNYFPAYTGDTGAGGGASIVNTSADIVSSFLCIGRSDSSFGYSVSNGWATPTVTPLDGSKQASFSIGVEANEVRVSNFQQFGTQHSVQDPNIYKSADHFAYFDVSSQYNRFMTNNAQAIQLDDSILHNYGSTHETLKNTFNGIVQDASGDFSGLNDTDGEKSIDTTGKTIKTFGIHNTDQTAGEGISSGTFNAVQGVNANTNVDTVLFSTLDIYTKVGAIINASGQIAVTPTAVGNVIVNISKPIPITGGVIRGSGASSTVPVFIEPNAEDAKLSFYANDTSQHFISYIYQYTTT